MFATEWGKKQKKKEKFTKYNFKNIKKKSLLIWSEHCTECAVPLCYEKCAKYRKRKDGRCKLFENGISVVNQTGVLNNKSYKVYFKGWSKLESFYRVSQHSKILSDIIYNITNFIFSIAKFLSSILEKKRKIWTLTTYAYKAREFIANSISKFGSSPDVFLISLDCPKNNITLILEIKTSKNLLFRKSFELKKGYNSFFVDYDELKFESKKEKMYILVYPTEEIELTFQALDFITFSTEEKNRLNKNYKIKTKDDQKKIKCVVWDLDNTLWNGILIEGSVKLNENVANIIKSLDSKGIVNSVVSKNNYEEAYSKLKEFNLDEYIIMPHINWIPKSVNIKDLAKRMNIGIDTIAFVDDSPFELSEVESNCPEVLCINVTNVEEIKQMDCFNVIVTEDSKNRRKTYRMMEKQQKELEDWEGSIDDFLKSCNMVLTISQPKDEEIQRCYELLQRTNQLNSSGRRLSLDEVKEIIKNKKSYASYVLKCKDKFGDYGIVGFSIVSLETNITITDFVISCRVANKKVEHTFIQTIFEKYSNKNRKKIYMNYKKTIKNGPIFSAVKDLNMKLSESNDGIEVYEYSDKYCKKLDIVQVDKSNF